MNYQIYMTKKNFNIKIFYLQEKDILEGPYSKIPSSLSIEDAQDKKGNKMKTLYRKNGPNIPGEELYHKN